MSTSTSTQNPQIQEEQKQQNPKQQNNTSKRTLAQLYGEKLKKNNAPKSYIQIAEEFSRLIQNLRTISQVSAKLRASKVSVFENSLKRCYSFQEQIDEQIFTEFKTQLDGIVQQRINSVIPLDNYIGLIVKKAFLKLGKLSDLEKEELVNKLDFFELQENAKINQIIKEIRELLSNKENNNKNKKVDKDEKTDLTTKEKPKTNPQNPIKTEQNEPKKEKIIKPKQEIEIGTKVQTPIQKEQEKKPQTSTNEKPEKEKNPNTEKKNTQQNLKQDQNQPEKEKEKIDLIKKDEQKNPDPKVQNIQEKKIDPSPKIQPKKPQQQQQQQPVQKTPQQKFNEQIDLILKSFKKEEILEENKVNIPVSITTIIEKKETVVQSSLNYDQVLVNKNEQLKMIKTVSNVVKLVKENENLNQKMSKLIQIQEILIMCKEVQFRMCFNQILPLIVQGLTDISLSQYKTKINAILQKILSDENEQEGEKIRVQGVQIMCEYHEKLMKFKQKSIIDSLVPQIAFVRYYNNKKEQTLVRTWKDKIYPTEGKEKMIGNMNQMIGYYIQQCYSPNIISRQTTFANLEELGKHFIRVEAIKNNIQDITSGLLNLYFDAKLEGKKKDIKTLIETYINAVKCTNLKELKDQLSTVDINLNY